jgi:hypothetical protein
LSEPALVARQRADIADGDPAQIAVDRHQTVAESSLKPVKMAAEAIFAFCAPLPRHILFVPRACGEGYPKISKTRILVQ